MNEYEPTCLFVRDYLNKPNRRWFPGDNPDRFHCRHSKGVVLCDGCRKAQGK